MIVGTIDERILVSLGKSYCLGSLLLRHEDAINFLVIFVHHRLVFIASKSSFAAFIEQTELPNGKIPHYLDVLITLKKRFGIVFKVPSLPDDVPSTYTNVFVILAPLEVSSS